MNDFEPVLVPAQPEDLDEAYALARRAAAETPVTDWDDEYPNREILCEDIAQRALYKIVKDGRIISILVIYPWAPYAAWEELEDVDCWDPGPQNPAALARFCVDPALQGRGLGRRIVLKTLQKAHELGYDGVRFEAAADNPLTLHLYDDMGFRRAGTTHAFGIDFVCYDMRV